VPSTTLLRLARPTPSATRPSPSQLAKFCSLSMVDRSETAGPSSATRAVSSASFPSPTLNHTHRQRHERPRARQRRAKVAELLGAHRTLASLLPSLPGVEEVGAASVPRGAEACHPSGGEGVALAPVAVEVCRHAEVVLVVVARLLEVRLPSCSLLLGLDVALAAAAVAATPPLPGVEVHLASPMRWRPGALLPHPLVCQVEVVMVEAVQRRPRQPARCRPLAGPLLAVQFPFVPRLSRPSRRVVCPLPLRRRARRLRHPLASQLPRRCRPV